MVISARNTTESKGTVRIRARSIRASVPNTEIWRAARPELTAIRCGRGAFDAHQSRQTYRNEPCVKGSMAKIGHKTESARSGLIAFIKPCSRLSTVFRHRVIIADEATQKNRRFFPDLAASNVAKYSTSLMKHRIPLLFALFAFFAAVSIPSAHAALTDGLVSYWPLNGNANDITPNTNDLTTNGTVTWVAGTLGQQAAQFDGSSGYLSLTYDTTTNYVDNGLPIYNAAY